MQLRKRGISFEFSFNKSDIMKYPLYANYLPKQETSFFQKITIIFKF